MHLLKSSALVFALLSCYMAFSQTFKQGFIIQANGDTLFGLIRNSSYEELSHAIEFKTSRKAVSQQLLAVDLQAFGFRDGDYFASCPVRFAIKNGDEWQEIAGQRFLFRLASGALSLYELRDGQESPLFIKKHGQPLQLLCFGKDGQPEYRNVLRAAVSDCDRLVFPEKMKLEPYAVQSLVEDYNGCGDLGQRLQVPFVQAWGFGSMSVMSLIDEYGGWGRGLSAEIRPFKKPFASRWTVGLDYENRFYQRDYGNNYKLARLNEIALKTRFYLPAKSAHFSPYGLIGTKLRWWETEDGYQHENGPRQVDNHWKGKEWLLHAGVGIHGQFSRHLFRLEVPFDRYVNLRLGYGIVLCK